MTPPPPHSHTSSSTSQSPNQNASGASNGRSTSQSTDGGSGSSLRSGTSTSTGKSSAKLTGFEGSEGRAPISATPTKTTTIGSGAKEDVFLSPRVVDQQAFSEFSSSLREIINQAATTAGALQKAAVEADRSRDGIKDVLSAMQLKSDHITRLLTGVEQRADQTRKLIEGAGGAVSKFEEVRVKADAMIEERLAQFTSRMDAALAAAESRIAAIEKRFEPLLTEANRRIDTLSGNLDAELMPTIAGLRHLCERAETLIGSAGPDGTVIGGLNDLVSRAEVAKRDAAFATRQLDAIRDQADQARQILGDSVNAAVPLIDEVAGVRDHLNVAIEQANALATMTQQGIETQFRTHQAATDETIARLTADTEIAKTELTTSIASANEARSAATQAAITGEEAAAHLGALLEKLEPWHGVLLAPGGTGDGELPMPLRQVLDRVRVDLKRDLSFVASALRSVAERTELAVDTSVASPIAANVISEPKPGAISSIGDIADARSTAA